MEDLAAIVWEEVPATEGPTAEALVGWTEVRSALQSNQRRITDMLSFLDYGGGSYSGGGGGSSGGFRDETRRGGFEEYDAGDYEAPRRSGSLSHSTRPSATATSTTRAFTQAPPAPKPAPAPEVDLLGGFDDETTAAPATGTDKALPALAPLNVPNADGKPF